MCFNFDNKHEKYHCFYIVHSSTKWNHANLFSRMTTIRIGTGNNFSIYRDLLKPNAIILDFSKISPILFN